MRPGSSACTGTPEMPLVMEAAAVASRIDCSGQQFIVLRSDQQQAAGGRAAPASSTWPVLGLRGMRGLEGVEVEVEVLCGGVAAERRWGGGDGFNCLWCWLGPQQGPQGEKGRPRP